MTPGAKAGPPVLLIAGPTAVGKSGIALLLAERLGGEIISVDSMQVYRGLDIGTDKPSAADRARVAHHLIDILELNERFDAAQFVERARKSVAEIHSRGRLPILCGGTGLYFRAYLQGLGDAPPADTRLRAELEATPRAELLRELAERDPVAYERIDRQNLRRVVRAVEVLRLNGKPLSQQRADWGASRPGSDDSILFFGLARSADDLRARIDRRVERMFERGLMAETECLLERGLEKNRTAMQALGYRQVVEYLRGPRTPSALEQTIERVKVRTRQFAKRQMTWFRREAGLTWIELQPGDLPESAVQRLSSALPAAT